MSAMSFPQPPSLRAAGAFDPQDWLKAWAATGGIVVRTADRLTLARADQAAADAESCRLRAIGLQPANAAAVIAMLDAQYRGEASI